MAQQPKWILDGLMVKVPRSYTDTHGR